MYDFPWFLRSCDNFCADIDEFRLKQMVFIGWIRCDLVWCFLPAANLTMVHLGQEVSFSRNKTVVSLGILVITQYQNEADLTVQQILVFADDELLSFYPPIRRVFLFDILSKLIQQTFRFDWLNPDEFHCVHSFAFSCNHFCFSALPILFIYFCFSESFFLPKRIFYRIAIEPL